MGRSPFKMDHLQPYDPQTVKRVARERALALGASELRVAPAAEDLNAREAMRAAFGRGDFATWPYGDDYAVKASSPQSILDGARSVISIAVPYRTPAPAPVPLAGRVSNYAWSPDYHHRVKALLRDVASAIDRAAGACVTAIACDTKPLAERAYAARSGVGWIGKHTNLIAPSAGSFVFLGEIVTTLDLPADPPLRKSCGACTRCIPACPTGALRGDYTIDATRCISDLTQRKDPIPRNLRPLIGLWVWGCDLCQLACPPNARAAAPVDRAYQPMHPQLAAPDLVRLLCLGSAEFKRTYARSAMGWRGGAVLRRNAAVALGNANDRATVPALARALQTDASALVRGHAAWALGRIGSPHAVDALRRARDAESDAYVREEVSAALEPFDPAGALQPV